MKRKKHTSVDSCAQLPLTATEDLTMFTLSKPPFIAAVLGVALLAGCDRTTKRAVQSTAGEAGGAASVPNVAAGGTAGGAASGPQAVPGGIHFVFEAPAAQSVGLAGSFNNWSTSADPMTRDAQGRWSIVKLLPAGKHQYKFVLNGGQQWKEDPSNPNGADDGYGGKNSVLEIGAAGGLLGAVLAGAGATAHIPVGTQPPTLAEPEGGPKKVEGGWLFVLDMPAAQSVNLAGSFNSWSTSADAMKRDAAGRWSIVKALPAGRHQYKFVVNGGQWKEDPANGQTADDGYGGKNSLVVVP